MLETVIQVGDHSHCCESHLEARLRMMDKQRGREALPEARGQTVCT